MTNETRRPPRRRAKPSGPARMAEGPATPGAKRGARRTAARAAPADRPRRVLFAAGALVIAGLAMVGVGPSELGKWTTLAGMIGLLYGIHTLGRAGPPGPIDAR